MTLKPVTVLMLAPVHRPWGNRVIREAATLVQAGYKVSAIMRTPVPSVHEGIEILAAPSYKGRLGRFLRIPQILMRALSHRADVYHLHNPDMIPVAFMLRLLGKTVIYDTHEDYRRRLEIRTWIPRFIRGPLAKLIGGAEVLLSKYAQGTFVTQAQMIPYFGTRTRLLRNAPKIDKAHLEKIRKLHLDIPRGDAVQLVYVGALSHVRGLSTMLRALSLLNEHTPVRLWLAGQSVDGSLGAAKRQAGWKYVDYLGLLSHEEALAYAMRADIGLAVLKDSGDHRDARPTKLFEYMSVGTPFVASDFPRWRQMAGQANLGWWITPEDPELLAAAIQTMMSDKMVLEQQSKQGIKFVESFNWEQESQVLLDTYKALADPSENK